jgi:carbonic anhydrase
VEVLKVQHIIVTGHYGCGGVAASVDGQRHGLIDHWIHPIRRLAEERREELSAITDDHARHNRLCELNVIQQVRNVASDLFVQDAWGRDQPLCVHGWVYELSTGAGEGPRGLGERAGRVRPRLCGGLSPG